MKNIFKLAAVAATLMLPISGFAQKYGNGLIDKTIAVVGNEMISLSELEQEILYMRMQGMYSDKNMRCEQLERMLENKLFLMQDGQIRYAGTGDILTPETVWEIFGARMRAVDLNGQRLLIGADDDEN